MGRARPVDKIRIAVLAGGWSGEREVSVKSGEAVCAALDREKYHVVVVDPAMDLPRLVSERTEIDLAFNLLHGKFGEDGRMQGFLDVLGIPFLGSGVLASAMAQNKRIAKRTYQLAGLRVARDVPVIQGRGGDAEAAFHTYGRRVVIKPVGEGSSLGVSICRSVVEVRQGLETALGYGREVLVEEYLDGTEITCCVMGGRTLETLPLIEIIPEKGYAFFDYEAKYKAGASREICPAGIPDETAAEAADCAKKAHEALGCRVWSRTDMIVRDGLVYLLETNTLPGMTQNSLFPLAARTAGLSMSALLDRLIAYALEE
jgi:D-alanine-D-alanine ligase